MAIDRVAPEAGMTFKMYISGVSLDEISARTGIGYQDLITDIKNEAANAGQSLVSRYVLHNERLQLILRAAWPEAMRGSLEALELCRQVIDQQVALDRRDSV